MEISPVGVRDAGEIERAVATFAHSADGGLIVTGPAGGSIFRELIMQLATRHKLPAVYADSYIVAEGGLISYGPDRIDQFRQAANYVDRILRGEKPADLPVQTPNKYELAINLKTAKTLGLTVPQALQASAKLLHCICLLLAQSRHRTVEFRCPLLGVKQTSQECTAMSAFDPKRTFDPEYCCLTQNDGWTPFRWS